MNENTLVILLGASKFPDAENLKGSNLFENAAAQVKTYFQSKDFGLGSDNFLDVFNSRLTLPDLLKMIESFVRDKRKRNRDIKKLILYYIGHGGFGTSIDDFYLALQSSYATDLYHTSLPFASLSKSVKSVASDICCYFIIDSCFSAAAVAHLQSPMMDIIKAKTREAVSGIGLLAAASKYNPTRLLRDKKSTAFTHFFIEALSKGKNNNAAELSLRDLHDLIVAGIRASNYKELAPELHVPVQTSGDITTAGLFPNKAYERSVVAKDSISEIITRTFFQNRWLKPTKLNPATVKQFSNLFSIFLSPTSNPKYNQPKISNGDLVDNICRTTLQSNSTIPVVVDGVTGSGKSLLLSIVYFRLLEQTKGIGIIPIFLDLHYYEEKGYNSANIQHSANTLLQRDIDLFTNHPDVISKKIILIVDGAEATESCISLFNILANNARFTKKIIGIRKSRNVVQQQMLQITGVPEMELTLRSLSLMSQRADIDEAVSLVSKIFGSYVHGASSQEIAEYLISAVTSFGVGEVDLFTLKLLLEGKRNSILYKEVKNLSQFLRVYCQEALANTITVERTARMAFDFFSRRVPLNEDEINSSGWHLIQSHPYIRNYLVALHVISLLKQYNGSNEFYRYVYPHEVNSLIKQILQDDVPLQKLVYKSIIKIWNKIGLNSKKLFTPRTYFSYILGRLTDEGLRQQAAEFLLKAKESPIMHSILNEFQYEHPNTAIVLLNETKRQQLLYFRSIYISLVYLENRNCANEYLDICFDNPIQENLNRGFHLEYYGDIQFQPEESESLMNRDNEVGPCSNTFARLSTKIWEALKKYDDSNEEYYPMFGIEIFTLCSLVQHRFTIPNNTLPSTYKEELKRMIEKIKEQQILNNLRLMRYLQFVERFVCNVEKIHTGNLYNLLYFLKCRVRRGWPMKAAIPKEHAERVSSHVYGAENIAFFFLPEHTGEDDYNKYKIIKMIHFHDLAEAFTGDLIKGEKEANDTFVEQEWLGILSNVGMVEDFANQTDLENLLKEFADKNTVNAKYANDCDKLDCLLQLVNYKLRGKISNEVYLHFKQNLVTSIVTNWGKKLQVHFLSIDKYQLRLERDFMKLYDSEIY